jgi:hypothetical protein
MFVVRRAVVALLSGLVTTALHAQAVDTAGMRAAAREFLAGCEGGVALWQQTLCGPMIFVEPDTRFAVATQRPAQGEFWAADGLYYGVLPANVMLANTATEWAGVRWAFVLAPLPQDPLVRRGLLFHEAFHRIQPALGLEGRDRLNPHLDERDGRYWLRLELRALARAVRSSGPAARAAVGDALLFRAVRQQQYPGADTLESALEQAEGIPEYTGARMALAGRAGDSAIAAAVEGFEQRPSYTRALGYGTGPLLGVLLDRYRPDWRTRIRTEGFAMQLAVALKWKVPADPLTVAKQRAARYGAVAIGREEDARVAAREALKEDYRTRLARGPVLNLPTGKLNMSFNPNTIVPLDTLGTVYPTGTFSGEWGTIEVSAGGALVSPRFNLVRVELADSAAGWRLTLRPGWRVVPGARPGDRTLQGP